MYATLHNPGGEQTVTKQIWFPALLKWDLACTTSLVLSLELGTHWQVTHCTTHWNLHLLTVIPTGTNQAWKHRQR